MGWWSMEGWSDLRGGGVVDMHCMLWLERSCGNVMSFLLNVRQFRWYITQVFVLCCVCLCVYVCVWRATYVWYVCMMMFVYLQVVIVSTCSGLHCYMIIVDSWQWVGMCRRPSPRPRVPWRLENQEWEVDGSLTETVVFDRELQRLSFEEFYDLIFRLFSFVLW